MSDAFTFDEARHIYQLANGRIIPGHTRVLDLGGLVDYSHVEPEILERKSELGREVHAACHLFDIGKKFKIDKRIEPRVEAWIEFCTHMRFKPFLSEYRDVYELDGLPFGMQIDAIGILDGWETLVERKCCATILPHHGVQLAGQAAAVKSEKLRSAEGRFRFRRRIVVQLNVSGYKMTRFEDAGDLQAFRSALYLTHWKLQHEKIYKGDLAA